MKKVYILVLSVLCLALCACTNGNTGNNREIPDRPPGSDDTGNIEIKKPNIYLYGYDEDVNVSLDIHDSTQISCTYPKYDNGWTVTCKPDGSLIDINGNQHRYLFWEGNTNHQYRITEGFCIKGVDTAEFLEEKLTILGLNDEERSDFISYWLPEMECSSWNVIAFKTEEYENQIGLNISPAPENTLRVLMVWYPWQTKLTYNEQELQPITVDRTRTTVVEWGGVKIGGMDYTKSNHYSMK